MEKSLPTELVSLVMARTTLWLVSVRGNGFGAAYRCLNFPNADGAISFPTEVTIPAAELDGRCRHATSVKAIKTIAITKRKISDGKRVIEG